MKKTNTTIVISVIGVLALAGIVVAYSLYNKPHRQAGEVTPDIDIQATKLYTMYVEDEAKADSLYLDKVLQVHGVVEEIVTDENGNKVFMLESPELFGISCTMENSKSDEILAMKLGTQVTVKGICHGMLMDVVLVKCVLVDK